MHRANARSCITHEVGPNQLGAAIFAARDKAQHLLNAGREPESPLMLAGQDPTDLAAKLYENLGNES